MEAESMVGAAERRIAAIFNDYFANFGIAIQARDVVAGSRKTIRDSASGWAITYRVDRDAAGAPSLEFYATNRRTNDRHVLISADGDLQHLDYIREWQIINSDKAVDDFGARNASIEEQLQERGLYPHGSAGP